MSRRAAAVLLVAALAAIAAPAAAQAKFGFERLELKVSGAEGDTVKDVPPAQILPMQAGSHPFALVTELDLNTVTDPELGKVPDGQLRDLSGELSPGLTANPFAVPQCPMVDFAVLDPNSGIDKPNCADSSVVGLVGNDVSLANGEEARTVNSVYNLVPPPGVAARLGFLPYGGPVPRVVVDFGIRDTAPFNVTYEVRNVTQMVRVFTSDLITWGNPGSEVHDEDRGVCGLFILKGGFPAFVEGSCPTTSSNLPFITLPRSCEEPIWATFEGVSWTDDLFAGKAETKDGEAPLAPAGCAKLDFDPEIAAKPTTDRAASPSGLDFTLDIADPGLTNPDGIAGSDLKKAVVTLPKGVTINPSQAEGLAVCTEEEFAHEKAGSEFGAGCPAASKIGTTEVETPQLGERVLKGSLFVAEPYRNRFGTLIALYMTFKEPDLGIGIKLAGKVEPDPRTGQLLTTFEDLPQQPFSRFRLHFREGGRSPLITPPLCGTYETEAIFTPWANPQAPVRKTAGFQITGGVDGGPCPGGGTPPFEPGFRAGTLNNEAGSYSPFLMRLTRRDGEQDLTRFSAKLPPGVLAKLAGTTFCPQARIEAAKQRMGKDELTSPSCPPSSRIGGAVGGAGVGSQLTYVKGDIYLAGPYKGAPLSVVAIVPAVAGPFDVGTVVTQQALRIDPRTGEAIADGSSSDPIPHILAGIPLSVRDIRVNVDKPQFTLNPTSCDPSQTQAQIWGGGSDPFSALDDAPFSTEARFQAANCRNLGFKPRLALTLKGGAKRGDHPRLRGAYRPRPGDANLEQLVLRLPRSAFLDQAHIRTICTRVQFAAGAGQGAECPAGAVYGQARAFTPLLDEPLEGPVILRSSNHNLPDFVASLHGLVDVEAVARIDSVRGGIRASFTGVPDAPLSKVVVNMQGGKKGLIVNSTNLCRSTNRAKARLSGQNGRLANSRPRVRATGCKKPKKAKRSNRRGRPSLARGGAAG